jgi:hypothetical protein
VTTTAETVAMKLVVIYRAIQRVNSLAIQGRNVFTRRSDAMVFGIAMTEVMKKIAFRVHITRQALPLLLAIKMSSIARVVVVFLIPGFAMERRIVLMAVTKKTVIQQNRVIQMSLDVKVRDIVFHLIENVIHTQTVRTILMKLIVPMI